MADSLAPAAPDTTSFAATATDVSGTAVTLDETYFYPEGGGQPADRGTIDGVAVVDVQSGESGVVHTLSAEPAFGAGDEVACKVDPEFRRYCRRAHTASHVLYGAGRRLLDDLGYAGFGITEEKVRVDFETTTSIDDDVLADLERLTNRAVWDSHDVTWEQVPVEEARERGDVAFNTKTEEGVMADADRVRVVTVGDWDVAACGGTHVRNTSEIGPVEVLERSNPGEGVTRVEFAVGPSAVERRAAVRRATLATSQVLGVPEDELAGEARRLREENDDLRDELAELRADAIRASLADLEAFEYEGEWWRVGTVSEVDSNAVGDAAKEVVGEDEDAPDVVVATGGEGRAFVVVAATRDATDPNEVVDAVTEEFGGGGGGGPTFAQGGGIDASPGDVARFVREL